MHNNIIARCVVLFTMIVPAVGCLLVGGSSEGQLLFTLKKIPIVR